MLDVNELVISGVTVERQNVTIADGTDPTRKATVGADGALKVDIGTVPTITATITNDGTFAKESGGNLDTLASTVSAGRIFASSVITGTASVTQGGIFNTRTQDGAGFNITSTNAALDVNVKSTTPTNGLLQGVQNGPNVVAALGDSLGATVISTDMGAGDTLKQVLQELKMMRLALVSLACDGGRANPRDFDPNVLEQDPEITIN